MKGHLPVVEDRRQARKFLIDRPNLLFPLIGAIVVMLCFLAGLLGTLVVERGASKLGLVQPPNERSSHTKPTPRGGGLAVAVIASAAWILHAIQAPDVAWWAVPPLICMIAILGFADDLRGLSPCLRFSVQIVILAALIWTGLPLPTIAILPGVSLSGLALAGLVLMVGLWWVNLFNFMDGIDGIAAVQAILLLLCGSVLLISSNEGSDVQETVWLALGIAAATVGFLMRNWSPARIFMGDAGSNALALIIFAVALKTIMAGWIDYPPWLILPCVFVADATVTLVRRIARGERPWAAHRRHAYQQLSRLWGHRAVSIGYGLATLLWAFPLAYLAQQSGKTAWWLVPLAYVPLLVLMIRVGAGGADEAPAVTRVGAKANIR